MEEKIEIKLKLLDNSVHKIYAYLTDTVKYLKEEIEKVTSFCEAFYQIIILKKILNIPFEK